MIDMGSSPARIVTAPTLDLLTGYRLRPIERDGAHEGPRSRLRLRGGG
jgi:hypothetical protein